MQSSKVPQITLAMSAHPRQGFQPLTVVIQAELINYQGQEDKFFCAKEEWDFGDGSQSEHQPNCKEKAPLQTKFIATHTYDLPGTYKIHLKLGGKLLKSQAVWINVLSNGI